MTYLFSAMLLFSLLLVVAPFIALYCEYKRNNQSHARLDNTLKAAGLTAAEKNLQRCQPRLDETARKQLTGRIFLSLRGRRAARDRCALRVQEALSFNEKREALQEAARAKFASASAWICDVYDDFVIVEVYDSEYKERLLKIPYSITEEGAVTLSDAEQVRRAVEYVAIPDAPQLVLATGVAMEAAREEFTPLSERAREAVASGSGEALVKIISPGWNKSGTRYYPADVLRRDGAVAFPANTPQFVDHRPLVNGRVTEGSVEKLAGRSLQAANYLDNGPDGPGLYAPTRHVETWRSTLAALKDAIGVSVDVPIQGAQGEIEGRRGVIVSRLLPSQMNSFDYVTLDGAGGKIISVQEALTDINPANPGPNPQEENTVTPEEKAALEAENARLRAELATTQRATEARTAAEAAVPATLPQRTRQRVIETLVQNAPAREDGTLDSEAFATRITEAATEAADELKAAGIGAVRGMGTGQAREAAQAAAPAPKYDGANVGL
jgi:hypothetical protein